MTLTFMPPPTQIKNPAQIWSDGTFWEMKEIKTSGEVASEELNSILPVKPAVPVMPENNNL